MVPDATYCECGFPLKPLPDATAHAGRQGDARSDEGGEPPPARPEQLGPTPAGVQPGELLFGRFKVLDELGRGGMGVVFKATDEQLDDQVVAVKVLAAQLATDPSAVARLKREVITARGLQHPGIIRVNQFYVESSQAGFDMEFLEGATLAEHVAGDVPGSPLTAATTIDRLNVVAAVVEQLAAAVDLIHAEQLVHRDIKPSNVMLVPLGDGGFAIKLLDFGIVHIQGGDLTGAVQPGTLTYTATELINGTGEPSPAADLFSLGMVAYLALTGQPARFGPESDAPSSLVDGLPSSVDEPILSCMAARPNRRPKTATGLAEAIRTAVEHLEEQTRQEEVRRAKVEARRRATEEKARREAEQAEREWAKAEALRKAGQEAAQTRARRAAEEAAQREGEKAAPRKIEKGPINVDLALADPTEVRATVGPAANSLEKESAKARRGIAGWLWLFISAAVAALFLILSFANSHSYRIVELEGQATLARGHFLPWGYKTVAPTGGEAAFEPIVWVTPPSGAVTRGNLKTISETYYALIYLAAGEMQDDIDLFSQYDTQAAAFESWYQAKYDELPETTDKMIDLRHKVNSRRSGASEFWAQRNLLLDQIERTLAALPDRSPVVIQAEAERLRAFLEESRELER